MMPKTAALEVGIAPGIMHLCIKQARIIAIMCYRADGESLMMTIVLKRSTITD